MDMCKFPPLAIVRRLDYALDPTISPSIYTFRYDLEILTLTPENISRALFKLNKIVL